jgi:hypothetical protein
LLRDSAGTERLCWRPWPCSACSGGATPIGYLIGCVESDPTLHAGSIEEIIRHETACLRAWVDKCQHCAEVSAVFPKISEGSEHLVYLDAGTARVFKATKKGLFGESYFLANGKMHQKNCSPLDYLIRLRLWRHVFGSAPEPLGITQDGQIITSHDFVTGTPPDQDEVNLFLEVAGFTAKRRELWLWERTYENEGFGIGLGDARADNFVKSKSGIVPIDVRLWFA